MKPIGKTRAAVLAVLALAGADRLALWRLCRDNVEVLTLRGDLVHLGRANRVGVRVCDQARWQYFDAPVAASGDSTNLFRPHRANLSWLHQDRLRRGSGPTWICLLAPRNGARPGREQDVPAPAGWGQMKLVLARWSRFDFVGWSQEHLVETASGEGV